MRRAARVDANHAEIVSALREAGCFVVSLAAIGKGCPDLLVGTVGKWYLLEVKDGSKPLSARKLTPDEESWIAQARQYAPVHVVNSVGEALAICVR